tara:strand:+ start:1122 stop:1352 length:231 start_codon:yes stop_codon:yes gene_type:complete
MAKNIKLYSSPTCQYCEMAKEYFKEKNIKYEELSVEDPKNAEKAIEVSSGTAVPVIDIDGKILLGFDIEKVEEALK